MPAGRSVGRAVGGDSGWQNMQHIFRDVRAFGWLVSIGSDAPSATFDICMFDSNGNRGGKKGGGGGSSKQ